VDVALIGFGEVGRILAEDLRAQGVEVCAFDLKLRGEAGEPMREHALRLGVRLEAGHARRWLAPTSSSARSRPARRCRWRRTARRA
jgi:UDP-N-acetylmuramoylalanine-D-glutamate ligase